VTDPALADLAPRLVWERFSELTRIPRPPKQEEEARSHVLDWAAGRGFATHVDAEGNVVVSVPASDSRAAAPTVVLQAHLDMVCERDPESPFDPRSGPIHVVREGDWVAADGTTLGADNGIGVAAAMAVAEDDELAHGPLELLFTVSEEQGLDGAKALDPSLVSGRLLLNLDGTSDTGLTIGCAGSTHAFARLTLAIEPLAEDTVGRRLRLAGVRGGHSGGDIARGRINAIKALARVLSRAATEVPYRLASFEGGVSRNAIPREATALVAVAADDEAAFRSSTANELAALREQYGASDPEVTLELEEEASPREAAPEAQTMRALDVVRALPTGVLAMSPDPPDAVETSASLNVAQTADGTLELATMIRSANERALEDVERSIQAVARLAGADVELLRSYPPWQPDLDSGLLAVARATYERLFEEEPKLEIVHGGLECAVIGAKLPGIEMVSIGPKVDGPHAPGERLSVSSTQRFYGFLGALLGDLSR
jgi:dipeptidase D